MFCNQILKMLDPKNPSNISSVKFHSILRLYIGGLWGYLLNFATIKEIPQTKNQIYVSGK